MAQSTHGDHELNHTTKCKEGEKKAAAREWAKYDFKSKHTMFVFVHHV